MIKLVTHKKQFSHLIIKIQVAGLSLCLETMSVPVHSEADMRAEDFNEDMVPMLVIQQAAQGEGHAGVRGGQVSFA